MEPKKVTSLDDLGGQAVPITVRRPDGTHVVVELRPLSEGEVWAMRRANKWPEAPIVDMAKTGPVRNFSDPAYVASIEDTNRLFAQKMLLACLLFDVPGETEDDKLATLQAKMGQYVYSQLIDAAQRINMITPEEIAAMASSFRSSEAGRAPSHGGAGADAEPVAQPTAG